MIEAFQFPGTATRWLLDRPGKRYLLAGLAAVFLAVTLSAIAADPKIERLLTNADAIKSSDYAQFAHAMELLDERHGELSPEQKDYLLYLKGWRDAYDGRYESSLALLDSMVDKTTDPTLRFRTRSTIVNVLSLGKRYEQAFSQLNLLMNDLPLVKDPVAREQGLFVIALVYEDIGQHDLSLEYATRLIDEHNSPSGACKGAQIKATALYKTSKSSELTQELQKDLDVCTKASESLYANSIRGYLARVRADHGDPQGAVAILKEHYDEVAAAKYPRLISQYNALLAQNYWQMGNTPLARQFAQLATESAVKDQYTEPLVIAYRLLYVIAKEQGDTKSALTYHEQYATADKAYLDDVSAQQLAYQRVMHEVAANKLQIDALNKQNHVLQLERSLDSKAIENVRLYIALLLMALAFIIFWAYKTKRSQLHFMKLSRRDGLTGIFNRPHFIELADETLATCKERGQELCLLICDLDHFKAINDQFGHAEGDVVLKSAVRACQKHLRTTDVFARIGGEEFGILLPGCSIQDARERAEHLREAICAIEVVNSVSASFGISGTNTAGYELRRLMVNADLALYQAKHAGRNRVVVYDAQSEARSSDFEILSAMAVNGAKGL